ncbi:MAG: type III pantothenate kinase [Candidatus Brocadiia bacterium]
MLLVANVGNTNVRLAGYQDGEEPVFVEAVGAESIDSLPVPQGEAEALVLGSVNPVVGSQVRAWAEERLGCAVFELRAELPVPMAFACESPHRIGADRVANAIGLHRRTGRGGIAVDFGTAVNLVVVSPAGEFVGGAIAPGLQMSARALRVDTALLPFVDPERTPPGVGCETETAIAAGLLWGLAGMVDRLVEKLGERWPDTPVLATGGDARLLVPHCRRVHTIAPHLTLEGLREAYRSQNRPDRDRCRVGPQ